jgi:hypothetical protein
MNGLQAGKAHKRRRPRVSDPWPSSFRKKTSQFHNRNGQRLSISNRNITIPLQDESQQQPLPLQPRATNFAFQQENQQEQKKTTNNKNDHESKIMSFKSARKSLVV